MSQICAVNRFFVAPSDCSRLREFRSHQLCRHDSEAAEVGEEVAALLEGDGDHARASGDDFAAATPPAGVRHPALVHFFQVAPHDTHFVVEAVAAADAAVAIGYSEKPNGGRQSPIHLQDWPAPV